MKRIVIIGCPGSGKSTMAQKLAELLKIPAVHLDKLFWKPGWVESTKEEFDEKLTAALAQETWIIDGNYKRTLGLRLSRADTVILLNYPRRVCLWRATMRVLKHRGRTRADMGEGCPERFDREFFGYIWNFKKDGLPKVKAQLAEVEIPNFFEIRNDKELAAFYRMLETRL